MFDYAKVSRLFRYEPVSGRFFRLVSSGNQPVGSEAGGVSGGYLSLRIDGAPAKAHRIAWLLMTHEWPASRIDHIDGNPLNNAWSNLRFATQSQNCANRRLSTNNTTGFKGVVRRSNGKFQAQTKHQGRRIHLGTYSSAEEAFLAYSDGMYRLFGDFARPVCAAQKEPAP